MTVTGSVCNKFLNLIKVLIFLIKICEEKVKESETDEEFEKILNLLIIKALI